eukprot:TRINITY_DN104206_c0_g1_i1.p1 TRINITY_DN104206_c0_g1~~TRINITY_DN104206_c0_g1_i1.p1  ORF type:complete len:244 (-),score=23.75 TRINITY_DN104206_c0_g1_i1:53-784(-)
MLRRVAVVTGGSRGLGKAITKSLLTEGYKVAVLSRTPTPFCDENNSLALVPCNVQESASIQSAITSVTQKFGPISVLVNAAGINKDCLLPMAKDKDIDSMFQTNLLGAIYCSREVLRKGKMLEAAKENQLHGACIVNVGSIIGLWGNQGQSVYSATKSGLVGFTKSLSKEWGARGVRVNLVCPGFLKTEMTDSLSEKQTQAIIQQTTLRRMGEPQEVANVVKLVLECTFMTGSVLEVDGGLTL